MTCRVLQGDYTGCTVEITFGGVPYIKNKREKILLNKENVASWELLSEDTSGRAAHTVLQGAAGILLGPVGLVGGLMSGSKHAVRQVLVRFSDGKESQIVMDYIIYDALVKQLT